MALEGQTVSALIVLAGVGLMPLGVGAQSTSSDRLDVGSQLMLTSSDTAFALRAAQDNLAEIQLGKLASVKASDADLRTFGKQVVDDHLKASDQLRVAAQQENMTLPDVMSAKDQATYEHLQKLSGSAFDKAYIERMLKDQEAELKASRREAMNGKQPDIRALASQMVVSLQDHLDRIRIIQSKLGMSR